MIRQHAIILAIPMYIQITQEQQIVTIGGKGVNKFGKFLEEICGFQAIFLSGD